MKKKLRYSILCLIILCGLFSSCVNSIDDLYDQYNENFAQKSLLEQYLSQQQTETVEEEDEHKTPDDPDFDENDMLFDEYFVYEDGTLNLAAPHNCYNYSWTLRDPGLGYREVPILAYWEGSGPDQREFVIYIPDTGLEAKTYQLNLVVYDRNGKRYEDVCGIVIYPRYDYKREDDSS